MDRGYYFLIRHAQPKIKNFLFRRALLAQQTYKDRQTPTSGEHRSSRRALAAMYMYEQGDARVRVQVVVPMNLNMTTSCYRCHRKR